MSSVCAVDRNYLVLCGRVSVILVRVRVRRGMFSAVVLVFAQDGG